MSDSDRCARLLTVVTDFYRCENARAWDGVRTHISDDIVARSYPGGDEVAGKDAYMRAMVEMYRGRDETFDVLSISADARSSTVHAELVIGGKQSVNVFELRDGVIAREREYLGEGYGAT